MDRALRQWLEDWKRAGLASIPKSSSTLSWQLQVTDESETTSDDRPTPSATQEPSPAVASLASVPADGGEVPPAEAAPSGGHEASSVSDLGTPHGSAAQLEQLAKKVRACQRCEMLAQQRTQTVFGVGDPNAAIMFVGEAPGADEDRVGEPFVGKAGQLLDKIIAACGWARSDLYICNILRCRPPGNRNPTDTEAANCREYLDGQITAVSPDWIVCWGSVAAKNLLGVDRPIGRMRQQLYNYGNAKVLCTYHPSYLLRNPSAKKEVWRDLQYLFQEMGHTPPGR